ncbi:hypothetical protein DVH24_032197 [Malus domestica]|uniref:Uncharacterized protein n=1 Tax=Malus domestica TaxID=3750 RepID=A0A498J2Y6_MALDO|nr:hypothetical protein DVH24_032197 [Malus domestica]
MKLKGIGGDSERRAAGGLGYTRCVWYVGRDGTERDEAFRPAFGAPKMGGTGCSTGQILSVFAFHLPPGTGLFHVCGTQCFTILRQIYPMSFSKITQIYPMSFSKITPSFRPVPSRPVPFRPVPFRPVPFRLRTKRTLRLFQKLHLRSVPSRPVPSRSVPSAPLGTVWYMGQDGTERDEPFRPTFGAPKNCGRSCSMRRNLADFSFYLFPLERPVPHPWNTNL